MATELNEIIAVGAVFSAGAVKPIWFSRQGRRIQIREIAYTWKTREGSTPVLHFSVTDGQGLYEIRFNTVSLNWKIQNTEGL